MNMLLHLFYRGTTMRDRRIVTRTPAQRESLCIRGPHGSLSVGLVASAPARAGGWYSHKVLSSRHRASCRAPLASCFTGSCAALTLSANNSSRSDAPTVVRRNRTGLYVS